jgi:hypothetical protein
MNSNTKEDMDMTWKELAQKINDLSEEQKNTDVTFYDTNDGQFYALRSFLIADKNEDVIDPGHPFMQGFI